MTVSYASHIHTVSHVGGFLKLLKLWKGSLLKGIWMDLVLYVSLLAGVSCLYRFYFMDHEDMKKPFEILCVYCGRYSKLIPLPLLLGFYVSLVVTRWWNQFTSLAWPDKLAMNLVSYLPGGGRARDIRRNVIRWACLCNILSLRMVSSVVNNRFPDYSSLVDVGMLTKREEEKLTMLFRKTEGKHSIVWYPMQWCQAVLRSAHQEGLIPSDLHYWALTSECDKVASLNGTLICYGWINIPLVYTQVVTIAVYSYFLASLFGSQALQPTAYILGGNKYIKVESSAVPGSVNLVGYDSSNVDTYIPIFNILEFIFYVGWLQVAVTLINPFGDDDEDFDVDYLIDRNIQIGLFMVEGEEVEMEEPPLSDTLTNKVIDDNNREKKFKCSLLSICSSCCNCLHPVTDPPPPAPSSSRQHPLPHSAPSSSRRLHNPRQVHVEAPRSVPPYLKQNPPKPSTLCGKDPATVKRLTPHPAKKLTEPTSKCLENSPSMENKIIASPTSYTSAARKPQTQTLFCPQTPSPLTLPTVPPFGGSNDSCLPPLAEDTTPPTTTTNDLLSSGLQRQVHPDVLALQQSSPPSRSRSAPLPQKSSHL